MLCPGSLCISLAGMLAASPASGRAPGEVSTSTPAPGPAPGRWIVRHPPTRHGFELGLAFGAMFPPKGHGLVNDEIQRESEGMFYQRYAKYAASFAVRAAYYPLTFLGVEVEAAIAPTYTREYRERANLHTFGGHLIVQLPRWSATPYLLAGAGAIGTAGALGRDRDPALSVGVGAKFFVSERLLIRCELRDNLAQALARPVGHYLQISIGLSLRLRARGRAVKAR